MLARHAPARALSSDRASTIHARPSAACVGGGRPGPSTLDTRLLRHLSVHDAGATASIGPALQRAECTAMPTEQGSAHRRCVLLGLAAIATPLCSRSASASVPTNEIAEIQEPGGTFGVVGTASVGSLSPTEKQIYQINKRIQQQNRVPAEFPVFVREGFNVKAIADGYTISKDGLAYKDFEVGTGSLPEEGQEVVFQYTGYNESGGVIDSSYRQKRPAQTRVGINGMIPGFELAIRSMNAGTKRRVIVPPDLGPPVGPSTFFSAKQCEVFDIELQTIRSCRRRQVLMFSDVVCE